MVRMNRKTKQTYFFLSICHDSGFRIGGSVIRTTRRLTHLSLKIIATDGAEKTACIGMQMIVLMVVVVVI